MIPCDFISSMVKLHNLRHFYLEIAYQNMFSFHMTPQYLQYIISRNKSMNRIVSLIRMIYIVSYLQQRNHQHYMNIFRKWDVSGTLTEIQIRILSKVNLPQHLHTLSYSLFYSFVTFLETEKEILLNSEYVEWN